MFKVAGAVMCNIDEVVFAEAKFANDDPNAFDICVHGTSIDDPNQSDWWRGEMSSAYGKGNFATMTQAQITMQTLRKAGFEGDDLSTIAEQLVGQQTPFHVKATQAKDDSGKVFYNVQYIGEGGGDQPKKIDLATMQARLSGLVGGAGSAPAPTPVATKAPAANPFAAKGSTAKAATGKKLPF